MEGRGWDNRATQRCQVRPAYRRSPTGAPTKCSMKSRGRPASGPGRRAGVHRLQVQRVDGRRQDPAPLATGLSRGQAAQGRPSRAGAINPLCAGRGRDPRTSTPRAAAARRVRCGGGEATVRDIGRGQASACPRSPHVRRRCALGASSERGRVVDPGFPQGAAHGSRSRRLDARAGDRRASLVSCDGRGSSLDHEPGSKVQ
jgi:hypothetical protein